MARTSWPARIGVTLLTTIAVGAVGTPALAATTGTASVSGTKITFKAGTQKNNAVTFTRSGRTITINDRVKIKAGKGCKPVKGDNTKVRCTTKKNPTQITAHLGDKNDALANKTTLKFYGYGGSGDDKLFGGTGTDRLVGDSGNDRIRGGSGNDSLDAGAGNDLIWGDGGNDITVGGTGNDRLTGGDGNDKEYGGDGNDRFYQSAAYKVDADLFVGNAGEDEVLYYGRKVGVRISNDGVTGNDGTMTWDSKTKKAYQTERDTISADIEILTGTDAADTILGGPNNDDLYGKGSGDTIYGNAGNDYLHGGGAEAWGLLSVGDDRGIDKLVGGAGNDSLDRGDLYYGDYDTPSRTPRPLGSDYMYGDATVSYEFADGPVIVSPHNEWGNDGQEGEHDQVHIYRNLIGSPYDDVLISQMISTALSGFIKGGAGDDRIGMYFDGARSHDPEREHWSLYGGPGADELDGGGHDRGDTYLYGSGDGTDDSEKADDGAADTLHNGTACHLHKTDSATGCKSLTEF
jgi:Ca2+-binding RTX toxin-like protein